MDYLNLYYSLPLCVERVSRKVVNPRENPYLRSIELYKLAICALLQENTKAGRYLAHQR